MSELALPLLLRSLSFPEKPHRPMMVSYPCLKTSAEEKPIYSEALGSVLCSQNKLRLGAPAWLRRLSLQLDLGSGRDLMVHEVAACVRLCSALLLGLSAPPSYALFFS